MESDYFYTDRNVEPRLQIVPLGTVYNTQGTLVECEHYIQIKNYIRAPYCTHIYTKLWSQNPPANILLLLGYTFMESDYSIYRSQSGTGLHIVPLGTVS